MTEGNGWYDFQWPEEPAPITRRNPTLHVFLSLGGSIVEYSHQITMARARASTAFAFLEADALLSSGRTSQGGE